MEGINDILIDYDNEKKFFVVQLKVTRIPSVNEAYEVNYKTKKIYKSRAAVSFSHEVRKSLEDSKVKLWCPWISPNINYKMEAQFCMKKSLDKRDTSNCIKVFEDAVFSYLGINDVRNMEVYACKAYIKEHQSEFINLKLGHTDYDPYFYAK